MLSLYFYFYWTFGLYRYRYTYGPQFSITYRCRLKVQKLVGLPQKLDFIGGQSDFMPPVTFGLYKNLAKVYINFTQNKHLGLFQAYFSVTMDFYHHCPLGSEPDGLYKVRHDAVPYLLLPVSCETANSKYGRPIRVRGHA